MDESTPADVVTGPVPVADEGQEPAQETPAPEAGQEPEQGRSYSEAYVKQLRQEAAERRLELGDLKSKLEEREEAEKTEAQKILDRLSKTEKKLHDAETRLLRIDVATEHGLDSEAATLLTGSTREEMELRAETLTKLLQDRQKAKPAAGFDGGARPRAPDTKKPEEAHQDLLMRALGRDPSGRAS